MTIFTYDPNVPAANNAPKDDQPNMQTNTASIAGIIAQDHIGFLTANGGYHTIIHQGPQGADPATIVGIGQTYTKTISGDQQLFYRSGNGIISQLTGPYTPIAANSGYTFLPGGILIQWLTTAVIPSLTLVNYPIPFPSGNPPFTIQITQTGTASAADVRAFSMFSSNFIGFATRITTLGSSPSESSASFSFIAIGN